MKLSRTVQQHNDIIDNLKSRDLYSVCRVFFRSGLIIFLPYARKGFPNAIEHVSNSIHEGLIIQNRLSHKRGNPFFQIWSGMHGCWDLSAHWRRRGRQRGPSEPPLWNFSLSPRVHLSAMWGERMAAILIFPVSPRGGERRQGEEQDGGISSALHHITQKKGYRISSKLTVISLNCS